MNKERAKKTFYKVRRELGELGILPLMQDVKLHISVWSRYVLGARGFVYDEGVPPMMRILGFRGGIIYIANDMTNDKTLLSVIRHEFAHIWAWANPRFLKRPWFREAFGDSYFSSRRSGKVKYFELSKFYLTHGSAYALTNPAEDFAETFELYLKHKNNLERFRHRPGLYKKLKAVKRAIREQGEKL
jgi:hypothetical protein